MKERISNEQEDKDIVLKEEDEDGYIIETHFNSKDRQLEGVYIKKDGEIIDFANYLAMGRAKYGELLLKLYQQADEILLDRGVVLPKLSEEELNEELGRFEKDWIDKKIANKEPI